MPEVFLCLMMLFLLEDVLLVFLMSIIDLIWWIGNDRFALADIFSYMAGGDCPQAMEGGSYC